MIILPTSLQKYLELQGTDKVWLCRTALHLYGVKQTTGFVSKITDSEAGMLLDEKKGEQHGTNRIVRDLADQRRFTGAV